MIRLALLLIGGKAFHEDWWVSLLTGLGMIVLSLAIVADAADGLMSVASQLFGLVFLIQGIVALARVAAQDVPLQHSFDMAKAFAMIGLGALIVESPFHDDVILAWLLAFGLTVDGLSRLATILVVRFDRWRESAVSIGVELLLAVLIVTDWPLPPNLDIPLCVGLLLALWGAKMMRFAFELRKDRAEVTILGMSLFCHRDWAPKAAIPNGFPDTMHDGVKVCMRVLIWTPTGVAKVAPRRPIIDRYLAAVDANGKVMTGHAALECKPDVYISHWPGEEIERSAAQFSRVLYAGASNDITGIFQPSYEVEREIWCPADQIVEFSHVDAQNLRAYWKDFSGDSSYNLTNRNCSIAVAGAIDAALEGSLHSRSPWLRFFSLLMNVSLWQAAYIRSRAQHLSWTPGLVLDYAHALHRIVEPTRIEEVSLLSARARRVRELWTARRLAR